MPSPYPLPEGEEFKDEVILEPFLRGILQGRTGKKMARRELLHQETPNADCPSSCAKMFHCLRRENRGETMAIVRAERSLSCGVIGKA